MVLLLGRTVSFQVLSSPKHQTVCTWGRALECVKILPWTCLRWTLWSPQNHRESLTEWVLLSYFVQRLVQLLQVMRELSNDWENHKKKYDAPEPYFGSWKFWFLGHRFYGAVFKFNRQLVHFDCGGPYRPRWKTTGLLSNFWRKISLPFWHPACDK